MNELLDEVALGLCFELHRSCKIGTFFLDDMDSESVDLHCIVVLVVIVQFIYLKQVTSDNAVLYIL